MKCKLLLLLAFFSINKSFSQIEKTIDSLRKVEQACLDSGMNMPYCSYAYMQQIDSLLNLVYKKLLLKLDPAAQKELKADELNWIKEKDLYFKEVDKEFEDSVKSGEWGRDMRMIVYDNKSDFIEKRVLLLSKKNSQSSASIHQTNFERNNKQANFIHFFPDSALAQLVAIRLKKEFTDKTTASELAGIHGNFVAFDSEIKNLKGIGYLKGIDSFGCYKNAVTEIPAEIGQLTKLKYLDLCKAFSLKRIPPEIGQLKELTMIRLCLTEVTLIPKEIGNLTNLKTLWLGSNGLTKIPKEIGNLKELIDLDISSNSLKNVPDEICNLTELIKLKITHCGLENLPENIGNLKNLQTLNLNTNNLKKLPKSIEQLESLTYLNVNDNYKLSESYKKYLPEHYKKVKAEKGKY